MERSNYTSSYSPETESSSGQGEMMQSASSGLSSGLPVVSDLFQILNTYRNMKSFRQTSKLNERFTRADAISAVVDASKNQMSVLQYARQNVEDIEVESKAQIASSTVALAAAGIDVSVGSPLQMASDEAASYARIGQRITNEAQMEANDIWTSGLRTAQSLIQSANNQRAERKNYIRNAKFNMWVKGGEAAVKLIAMM